jgi:hypothetical protein
VRHAGALPGIVSPLVAARLGSVTDGPIISRLLQLLADNPHWDAIAAAVTRLAAYLDDNDVPIDYQRRRRPGRAV